MKSKGEEDGEGTRKNQKQNHRHEIRIEAEHWGYVAYLHALYRTTKSSNRTLRDPKKVHVSRLPPSFASLLKKCLAVRIHPEIDKH